MEAVVGRGGTKYEQIRRPRDKDGDKDGDMTSAEISVPTKITKAERGDRKRNLQSLNITLLVLSRREEHAETREILALEKRSSPVCIHPRRKAKLPSP